MGRRQFSPATKQFDERQITRVQKQFIGMYEDIPVVPENGLRVADNYRSFKDRLEPRLGSIKWSDVKIPAWKTGITMTKAATPSGNGYYAVEISPYTPYAYNLNYIGAFLRWPDGSVEKIVAQSDGLLSVYVEESAQHTATYAGEIVAPFCGWTYHQGRKRIVLQLGYDFYVADETFSFCNKAYTRTGTIPAKEHSQFGILGNSVIAFNKNGVFSIDLDRFGNEAQDLVGEDGTPTNFYTYRQLNCRCPESKITPSTKTPSTPYGYRYFYTGTELSNPGGLEGSDSESWNRTVRGVRIIAETGPFDASLSGELADYSEIWTEKPIGDSSITYAKWIRTAALPTAYDTISELSALSTAQFKMTADGVTKNIKATLTGATTWDELADRFTSAISSQFSECYCVYDREHETFTLINSAEGGRITAIAAGDCATDISSMFKDTVGSDPAYGAESLIAAYQSNSVANMMPPPILSNTTIANPNYQIFCDNFTHVSVYRTLDIGENGINNVTRQGNSTEIFVWVGDFPIKRAHDISGIMSDGSGTSPNGKEYNAIILLDTPGKDNVFDLSDVGLNINTNNSKFTTIVDIADSGSGYFDTAYVICNEPYDGSIEGGINNIIFGSNTLSATDEVSDDTLRARMIGSSDFMCKNRLWRPFERYLPAWENNYSTKLTSSSPERQGIGCYGNGFMLSSYRDENDIYYGQIPDSYPHLAGYGNQARQIISLDDAIQWMCFVVDSVIVFCSHSIYQIPLSTYSDVELADTGLSVSVLSVQREITKELGCVDYGSIRPLTSGSIAFRATDGSQRVLLYDGSSFTLSDNLSKDKVQTRLSQLTGISASAYDTNNGLILWGKESGQVLDKSFRMAVSDESGVGWSLNSGDDWITPEAGCSSITVFDNAGRRRTLILDIDGYVYDISGEYSAETGTVMVHRDKVDTDGTGGTAIQPSALFPEDTGTFEHHYLQHLESHIYLREADNSKRRVTGYDQNGYPTNSTFDLTLFADGERQLYSAKAINIPKTGDIAFDRDQVVIAHRMQLELSANNGEHIVVGRQQYYKAADKTEQPDERSDTETDHQSVISLAAARLGWSAGTLINMQTGAGAMAEDMTEVNDITDMPRAIQLQSTSIATMQVAAPSDFSIMLTVKDLPDYGSTTYDNPIIAGGVSVRIQWNSDQSAVNLIYTDTSSHVVPLAWDGSGWLFVLLVREGMSLRVYEAYQ